MAHGSEMAVDAIPDDYEGLRTLAAEPARGDAEAPEAAGGLRAGASGGDGLRNGGGHRRTRGRAALHPGALRQEPRL